MIEVFKAEFRFMGSLNSLNVKTQEFAFTFDEVRDYFDAPNKEAYIAKVGNRHIGFALVTFDKVGQVVIIDALGVHPDFRRTQVATNIVRRLVLEAHTEGGYECIRISVPCYLIEDKEDPWNIEQWLWKCSFKVNGESHICRRYNRDYAVYRFDRKLA